MEVSTVSKQKKIVCYSGGKDSTAMLIHLLQTKQQIDDIIYCDMGEWMWEGHLEHIHHVEETLNVKIHVIPCFHEIRKGFERWGFPSILNRWCTGIKRESMKQYISEHYPDDEIIQYIGYCADEEKRTSKTLYSYFDVEYPLMEAGITSEEALQMCYKMGFTFGDVYSHHSHYNCWMCPLQRKQELEYIYLNMPEKWQYLRQLQQGTYGYYQNGKTIMEYEQTFWEN